jgi:hypothetical protein
LHYRLSKRTMVALLSELWFNASMLKAKAIEILGGTFQRAAQKVGTSRQAIEKWPNTLPPRIADRVIAACVRYGIAIPADLLTPSAPSKAQEASPSGVKEGSPAQAISQEAA